MALTPSGTADRIAIAGATSINDLAALTVAVWVFRATVADNVFPIIAAKMPDAIGYWSLQLQSYSGGVAVDRISWERDYGTTNLEVESANNGFTASAWNFIAANDGGAGVAPHVYKGSLTARAAEITYGTQITPAGTLTSESNAAIWVGNRELGANNPFGGRIAWIGIWNRVLSLNELIEQQFRPRVTSGCKLFMHPGYAGTGTQPDWSGNANNGTVTGSAVSAHVPLGPFFAYDDGWLGGGGTPVSATRTLAALGVG